jgi:mycofactocin system transcriptional regulator
VSTGQARLGRPSVTSHAWIEEVAFRLFHDRGFDATTVQAIADEAGIGRRTLFRYFESKNDIPWGQFDDSLAHFRETLEAMPPDLPLHEAVHRGVLEFNRFDSDALPQHRQRMVLILRTPALQAHSVLRYGDWRNVIAEYIAGRLGVDHDSLLPRTVGQVSLALALSAYEHWLDHEDASLQDLLDEAMSELRNYLSGHTGT